MRETKTAPDRAQWALNGRIATEIMGWQTRTKHTGPYDVTLWIDPGGHEHLEPMRYATSLNAVALVEDEIERRGLANAYVRALLDIVWSGEYAAYEYPDEVH